MAQPFFLECKNDDGKQSEMRLIRIVTTLYVQHTFFAFSLPSLHGYDVEMLISRFIEDVTKPQQSFLCLSSLDTGSQESNYSGIHLPLTLSENCNKRDKV